MCDNKRSELIHSLNAKYGKVKCECSVGSLNEDCLATYCIFRYSYQYAEYYNETGILFCGCSDEAACVMHCCYCSFDERWQNKHRPIGCCEEHQIGCYEEEHHCGGGTLKPKNPLNDAAKIIQNRWQEARLNPYCRLGFNTINRQYDEYFNK